jgi:hypothetical protein
MSRKRKQVVVMPAPKADPPADKSSWPHAIGTLAIAAIIGIGIFSVLGWVEVRLRPPPGWVCWNVEKVTADGRQHGSRCGPAPGWHIERWENVGDVAVPNGVEWRQHFVSESR